MIDGLLDTSVVIDVHRGYVPSMVWMRENRSLELAVSSVVWMEAVEGARSKLDQQQILALLGEFDLLYAVPTDCAWAMDRLRVYRLSHGLDMMDCLIASSAQRLNLPLYTRNLKHFTPIIGDLARKPY